MSQSQSPAQVQKEKKKVLLLDGEWQGSGKAHGARNIAATIIGNYVVAVQLLHGLQHARFPYPSLSLRVDSNSCPLSQWCHPTITSSVIPFSSCLLSFPASGSFLMSRPFTSGGQSIGASASASALSVNVRGWFPLGLDWLVWSPCSPRDSQKSSPTPQFKSINCLMLSLLYGPILICIHEYWKNHSLTIRTFVCKVMSLLFNTLSRLVIAFLPRSKRLLISWLQSPSAVVFGAQEYNVCHCFHCFPIYSHWSDGTRWHDLSFVNVEFQTSFFTVLFHFHQGGSSVPLRFLP